jgi:serine phosphatase RsbU (regulator of sigma subunit)
MAVFQVSSRTVPLVAPPKKQPRRSHQEWFMVIRFILAISSAGGFFTLLAYFRGSNDTVFILLPVFVYLAATQFQRYHFKIPLFTINMFLNSTPIYLLLTFCFMLIYYSLLTGIVLVIHQDPAVSHIILITTTLTWVIILDPLRIYVQKRIEQRFNLRNREAAKAIEAFTSTLREEIDLDQLSERFITLIEQTMQPYSVSLWTRISSKEQAQSNSTEEIVIADDDPLMAYVLRHPGALEIDRLQLDSPALQEIKLHVAEMILPLASQGELLGLLILGPHLQGEAYTAEERIILNTLAPQVAPALRVAQMVQEQQEQTREHDRIEQELSMARDIQHTFLPKDVPALLEWEIEPYYQPAREVGGDFYDFLLFDDGRLGIVIGDVTDKGIPAALVMTATRTMLRTAAQEQTSPCEVFARVNDLLYADIPDRMFVTCFYALLDPKSGRLCYANAGHDLPYRCHNHDASALWATGMPLGMMPGSTYEEHEITIAPGESLLFYSDGLVEAHNTRREMFDTPRLKALLTEWTNRNGNSTSLIEDVLSELKRFTGEGWEQEDDVTLVTLRRMPEVLENSEQQAISHLLQG